MFLFALFYLIGIIVCNISAIVAYATWNFDEDVTTTVMDGDKEKKVEVNGSVVFGISVVFQVYSLSSCSLTIFTPPRWLSLPFKSTSPSASSPSTTS